jgi:hypothetical protein
MAEVSDIKVRITAEDHFSPVLRKVRREVFWWQWGDRIIGAVGGAIIFASGLLVGLIVS